LSPVNPADKIVRIERGANRRKAMTYNQTRDDEQLRILQRSIGEFILRFRQSTAAGNKYTVILFPGGMASTLIRADLPYRPELVTPQSFNYVPVWLNPQTLTGDALTLEMHSGKHGDDRDLDDRIILADGAVTFEGRSVYDGFSDWCQRNDLNLFVFGWDWRRRLENTVSFFLKKFLPVFQQSVIDACGADPLDNLVLIGHSFGGPIIKLILHESDPSVDRVKRAITVAGPFYGYPGQLHRYFEGDSLLNDLGKDKVVKAISSLPSLYTLQLLDYRTYRLNKAALQADTDFPLKAYPSLDATTKRPADAYRPRSNGPKKIRYPTGTGFRLKELKPARAIARMIAAPLDCATSAKLFSIRAASKPTKSTIKWDWITPQYDPENANTPSPVADGPEIAGDDTQPAWTARLATQPHDHVVTLTGDVSHICMMDNPKTQNALAKILGLPPLPVAKRKRPRRLGPVKPATSKEALAFVRKLQKLPRGISAQRIIDAIPKEQRLSLALRIMMDILKRSIDEPSRRGRRAPGRLRRGQRDEPG